MEFTTFKYKSIRLILTILLIIRKTYKILSLISFTKQKNFIRQPWKKICLYSTKRQPNKPWDIYQSFIVATIFHNSLKIIKYNKATDYKVIFVVIHLSIQVPSIIISIAPQFYMELWIPTFPRHTLPI